MLIPDNITEFNSHGERILYFKFKNDRSTDSMYVLHSLFTNHHLKNISGELDFFILAPNEGFFSIEVKHGGISRVNGDWCFTDRHGNRTIKKTGPFAQQNATMNSIRNYVLDKIRHKEDLFKRFSKLLWGTGVAFTSMEENIDFGPEAHSWQILKKQELRQPIGSYVSTLSRGAHNEAARKYWYDPNMSRPTKKDCEDLLKILRGDFEINYSEINRINDNESLIEEYTREQFEVLDFINFNPRCLITGPAGTGKTLMALEIAMRQTHKKLNVGLFCFNKGLGEKLARSIQNQPQVNANIKFTGTLHSYLSLNTNLVPPCDTKLLQKYYSEDLIIDFFIKNENISDDEKLDYLIVDEAQDLITPFYLGVFDLILKGGFRNGNWVMFGDFSNQAIYLNQPEQVMELLHSQIPHFAKLPPLRINCRNTKKIASHNTLLTGSPIPFFTTRISEGKKVISKYPAKNAQAEEIRGILTDIIKRRIPLDRVTLLSPKKVENTVIGNFEPVLNLVKDGVKMSTIQGYKGLENTIIILYDFDEITSEQATRLLYVGISRAKQELYLVLDRKQEESVKKLFQKNYPKLV